MGRDINKLRGIRGNCIARPKFSGKNVLNELNSEASNQTADCRGETPICCRINSYNTEQYDTTPNWTVLK